MASDVDLSWVWAIGLFSFAFGLAFGVGIAYLTLAGSRRTKELQEKCDALQQDFDTYREQVSQHFQKTSELVQTMTDSYRDVYEHLASGSQSLCQEPVNPPSLDLPGHTALDSGDKNRTSDYQATGSFSDAETSGLDDTEPATFLGDSPQVPVMDTRNPATRSTHHIPSQ